LTATHTFEGEHATATPATGAPGKTLTGCDHRPAYQLIASPVSPIATHAVLDAHEIEYAKALANLGMLAEGDQPLPRKVVEWPESVTAMQNSGVAHETEISPFGPVTRLGAHFAPLKVRI
jgi:hypothetical protein